MQGINKKDIQYNLYSGETENNFKYMYVERATQEKSHKSESM